MCIVWECSSYNLGTKCLGVNALGGLIASFIVNILRACWLIKQALALIPPGTGYGGIIIRPGVPSTVGYVLWVSMHVDLCFSCGVPTSVGIIWGDIHVITGTSLGVLLCIWRQCMCFVLINPFCCWVLRLHNGRHLCNSLDW